MNTIKIIPILLLVGAAQGALLSLVLLTIKRANRTANRLLALLLFLFSFMMFFHSLSELSQAVPEESDHDLISQLVFFLFGPLFYLYTIALTHKDFRLGWKESLHALPFIISMVLFTVLLSGPDYGNILNFIDKFLPWLMMIQMSIYLFLVIKLLQEHSSRIKQQHSSLEKINLNWLRFLTVGNLIIWPVAFLVEMIKADSEAWNYVWLLISLFIYMMGYLGMRQSEIFAGQTDDPELQIQPEHTKYRKSTLKPSDAEKYFMELQSLMEKDKPYLNNNLTLPSLAGYLGISVHHLSQVINGRAKQNFYDFINRYRVEEAKTLLSDSLKQNLTIAALCYEAGFNSLSSFNTLFKKVTGATPSQFRRKHLDQK
jgi:AraC-like DNA-binding protein